MDPLQSSSCGQLAQIPPDRVFGDAPLASEILGDNLPLLNEAGENQLLSLRGEHCGDGPIASIQYYTKLHEIARKGILARMLAISPMLIMVCGPYTSGTGGDPDKITANRERLESFALPIYEKGHLPVIGEWLALPIIRAAGGRVPADEVFRKYQYPVAHRLLARCDAVLRIPGESTGADLDVQCAQRLGLRIFSDLADIPGHPEKFE